MGFGKTPTIKFRPSFSFERPSFQKARFINLPNLNLDHIRSPLSSSSAAVSPSAGAGLGAPGTGNNGATTTTTSVRNPVVDRVKGYFDGLRSPAIGPLRDEDDVEKQSMVSVDMDMGMRDTLLEQPETAKPSRSGGPGSKLKEGLKTECARVLDGIGTKVVVVGEDRLWQDKRLLGGGFVILVAGVLCYSFMI